MPQIKRDSVPPGHIKPSPSRPEVEPPSPRQRDILILLSEGLSADQIARRIGVSDQTIKNTLTVLYARWQCWGAAHAVALAIRNGYL